MAKSGKVSCGYSPQVQSSRSIDEYMAVGNGSIGCGYLKIVARGRWLEEDK